MDDIRQERSNEGPTLKLNKRFKQTSLNKKFGPHVKESMVYQDLKNKLYSIPRSKVISRKTLSGGGKLSTFQKLKIT